MKTYIIDWGEGTNGARYGLVQADDLADAFWEADAVGGPFRIALLELPETEDRDSNYVEIPRTKKEGANPFGPSLWDLDLDWKRSPELLMEAL